MILRRSLRKTGRTRKLPLRWGKVGFQSRPVIPMTPFIGVRISWLIVAKTRFGFHRGFGLHGGGFHEPHLVVNPSGDHQTVAKNPATAIRLIINMKFIRSTAPVQIDPLTPGLVDERLGQKKSEPNGDGFQQKPGTVPCVSVPHRDEGNHVSGDTVLRSPRECFGGLRRSHSRPQIMWV